MSIVKSFSVGNGDCFYINHNSKNFTMIDCNLVGNDVTERILDELHAIKKTNEISRFISTHPDQDHIAGLKAITDCMGIENFYCVENKATKSDETDDFKQYKVLRDSNKAFHVSKGCSRKWMNQDGKDDDGKYRGSSGLSVLWPDVTNRDYQLALEEAGTGKAYNNMSLILQYKCEEGASFLWMGDLESDFQEKIFDNVNKTKVDVLFAPHHGRKSGRLSKRWLQALDPKVIVIGEAPSRDINYYNGYDTITQNTAGDLTFICDSNITHIYASKRKEMLDFATDKFKPDLPRGNYIGSLPDHHGSNHEGRGSLP